MSYLSMCGFEIYGSITGVCADGSTLRKQRKMVKNQVRIAVAVEPFVVVGVVVGPILNLPSFKVT